MYCDFCGIQLSYHVRYCRHCGRQLRDRSGDTQPLPVIDEVFLKNTLGQVPSSAPWYKLNFKKKMLFNPLKVRRIVYYSCSLAIIGALIYILATLKTIKQYQILTAIASGLLAIGIWRKG